jgi:hypothetical protein
MKQEQLRNYVGLTKYVGLLKDNFIIYFKLTLN